MRSQLSQECLRTRPSQRPHGCPTPSDQGGCMPYRIRRSPRRSRAARALTTTASAALLLAALPAGVAFATSSQTSGVHPGESIQAAVDQPSSGDTIHIEAGTYKEAVCVDHKALNIECE